MIADQIPHFYRDAQGNSKRNMLQIEVDDAQIVNNFPKDGTVMLRLQDDKLQKAFKLTVHETLVLGEHLTAVAKELLKQKRDLWKNRGTQ
jgi:hypothetical protein